MQNAYSSLFNADLTKLPDPVLKSIRVAVDDELRNRRRERSVQRDQYNELVGEFSKKYRCLPKPHHSFNRHWLRYLTILLDQDWSHLFSGDTEPKYYVYVHYEPSGKSIRYVSEKAVIRTDGYPFYVGKGTGDRAFDLKRNQGHGAILRGLIDKHSPNDIVSIVKDGLTESQALELESKLIYFFGTKYEKGRRGILVNLDIPVRPKEMM